METGNRKKSLALIALLLLGIIMFVNSNIVAGVNEDKKNNYRSLTKAEVANFLKGLDSDNNGVRKSCIYFAGKYKITEALDILKEQLSDEEDPETSVLLVLSIYEILENNILSNLDKESKIKGKFAALYE